MLGFFLCIILRLAFEIFCSTNNRIHFLNTDNHHKNSIAIVDDEEDIVTLFTEVLQDNGYKIKGFTNPLLALEHIHKYPNEFGLIILDYRMSPMQGCELANKISAINSKIKMVLITAYNDIVNNVLNLEIVKKPITNKKCGIYLLYFTVLICPLISPLGFFSV